jgi:hypothetical protein
VWAAELVWMLWRRETYPGLAGNSSIILCFPACSVVTTEIENCICFTAFCVTAEKNDKEGCIVTEQLGFTLAVK